VNDDLIIKNIFPRSKKEKKKKKKKKKAREIKCRHSTSRAGY
jgi:hypothetical protein